MPAVAAYVPTYATRTPYLTPAEYLNAPTGVDTSQLIPSGSGLTQDAALKLVIGKASAWANRLCKQVLAASVDTASGRYRIDREGVVKVPCAYTPVIAVTSVNWGWQPADVAGQALTDLSNLWIGPKVVQIPLAVGSFRTMTSGLRVYVVMKYENGYANTTLDGTAGTGATSITVESALGIFPGLQLNLSDGATSESVTVDPSYTFGSVSVPLTAPLVSSHQVGASCSALPLEIKEAVTHLTSALIRTRGAQAVVMGSIHEQPSTKELTQSGGLTDVEIATGLLADFRRSA